uniref:myrosinase 1-like n=1 Tax=Vespula vulgaris TaxID=7454 RepID=UPI00212FF24A|nr:myrosinase 1-like [Vespula vulgaris]
MVIKCFFFLKAMVYMLLVAISIVKQIEALTNVEFPDGFQLGVASASYQIEGAWNTNGKGVNIWDIFTHNGGGVIRDNSNGDLACDSYHRYKEDVQLISDIGADFYRFSLSWSRILPNGFSNVINQDGLNYYKNLIDELLAKGIQSHVSIFHWDLPENMEKLGGWTNELIIDYFVDYARIVFRELGPKVKLFYTLNEPAVFCGEGYGLHTKAPGKNITGIGSYLCMHNALKAHAKVYHMYDKEFRSEQKGLISIVISSSAYFAKNENNLAAEDIAFQFICGWVGHPIYSKTGDYPQVMKNRIAENSRIQGYSKSRLPEFTQEWIEYIRGTSDFFALNHYTSNLVEIVPKGPNDTWYGDSGIKFSYDPKWPSSGSSWLKIVPEGFRKILNAIKNEYNNPPVIITENGVSDDGKLSDKIRINYLSEYLKAMLQAIYEDGCNIKGYTVWSLIDNFEWENGYIEKFGLVQVDFASPNRTRTPKMSMEWYKNVIKQRKITNFAPNTNEYDVVSVR